MAPNQANAASTLKNNNAFSDGREGGPSLIIILSYISAKNQPENNLTGPNHNSPDGF